jgi:hypothetical protein
MRSTELPRVFAPANDNRATILAPHNGGCSTTSGMRAVSVQRVPTLDKEQVAA